MKSWFTLLCSSWLLPAVLSTTAGAVDVIGFLALGGLFTAHITGNVCIAAAHFVTGGFSQVGPLLAVPVFMAVLGLLTVLSGAIARAGSSPLRPLLLLQAALLAGFLGVGVAFGPFPYPDSSIAVLAGMLGVAAMATQNALVKLSLKDAPSTAVMTTNITQLTVDLATLFRQGDPDELAEARRRASMIIPCIVGFVVGCAAGASLEAHFALWALARPVALAVLAVPLSERRNDGRTTHRGSNDAKLPTD
jgi:uncharacterized membrane protein YoaK (UPF0700 family)